MERIIGYVPISVGPSKLDQVLAYCPNLSDENKEKICIIQDIVRLGKLIGNPPLSAHNFYNMYEMATPILEAIQQNIQIEVNTKQYAQRVRSSSL